LEQPHDICIINRELIQWMCRVHDFALPYDRMDLCLYAYNHGVDPEEVAPVVELTPEQVRFVYRDIESKRRTTRYLHLRPLLVEPVEEV
jgi:NAD+ synthase